MLRLLVALVMFTVTVQKKISVLVQYSTGTRNFWENQFFNFNFSICKVDFITPTFTAVLSEPPILAAPAPAPDFSILAAPAPAQLVRVPVPSSGTGTSTSKGNLFY